MFFGCSILIARASGVLFSATQAGAGRVRVPCADTIFNVENRSYIADDFCHRQPTSRHTPEIDDHRVTIRPPSEMEVASAGE